MKWKRILTTGLCIVLLVTGIPIDLGNLSIIKHIEELTGGSIHSVNVACAEPCSHIMGQVSDTLADDLYDGVFRYNRTTYRCYSCGNTGEIVSRQTTYDNAAPYLFYPMSSAITYSGCGTSSFKVTCRKDISKTVTFNSNGDSACSSQSVSPWYYQKLNKGGN